MSRFLSRRSLLKGALAGVPMLGAPYLSRSAFAAGSEVETVEDDEKGQTLNFLGYEGYDSPTILDPFSKLYESRVRFQLVSGDADALNKIRGGQNEVWDLINLNNPWANVLYNEGYIQPLDEEVFRPYYDRMLPRFKWPYHWARAEKDGKMIGMVQRFGPMSMVIDEEKISRQTALKEGYSIALEESMRGKFGLLGFPNETMYTFCIMAGVNPYKKKTPEELEKCHEITRYMIKHARVIEESPAALNNALLNGEIWMYQAGGTWSVSSLRADGYPQFMAVSPGSGPIDGRGGIAYVEITSVVNRPKLSPIAHDFLHYMQTPEAAYNIAVAGGSLNPVCTIDEIVDRLTPTQRMAIQYGEEYSPFSLVENMDLCAEFAVNPDYDEMVKVWTEALKERA